ncbi:hypothetical protein ACQPW3_31940 [Actinosynnema sp. CA-248983]
MSGRGAVRPAPVRPGPVVLWGGAGSGRTTFLAALGAAAAQAHPPWQVTRRAEQAHEYTLSADFTVRRKRFLRYRTDTVQVAFDLAVTDRPGADFTAPDESCGGIVYFFDPTRSSDDGAADAIAEVAGDGLVPHPLAVCVTKYDEPDVLAEGRAAGLLAVDVDDMGRRTPMIPVDFAERFFDHLCDTAGAERVRQAIKRHFAPESVRYFTTSSIGFHQGGPVNVLEPLLWVKLGV